MTVAKKSVPGDGRKPDSDIVADAVSSKLKAFYDDVSSEQVPDRFLQLLARLDEGAAAKSGDK